MAAVNPLASLPELLPMLREADRRAFDAIEKFEDLCEVHLPEDAFGCVLLKAPDRFNRWWVHAIYKDGMFWLDKWRPVRLSNKALKRYEQMGARPAEFEWWREDLLHCDEREFKILFMQKIREVWIACGGNPFLLAPATEQKKRRIIGSRKIPTP